MSAPKPRPPALTPVQKARVIDLRNEQARTRTPQAPKTAPKPQGIAALDRPAAELEAEGERIWAERDRRVAALTLRQAAARTHSPSDRIAYALDVELLLHPDACSTNDDYPGWAEHVATLTALNDQPGRAS